ncbi:MAG TPA: hypothetical protein VLA93_13455 [Pyrinomonadaceae bacterium]|nr:hypothetical protein [Pyrinomonadaceae bacterium]
MLKPILLSIVIVACMIQVFGQARSTPSSKKKSARASVFKEDLAETENAHRRFWFSMAIGTFVDTNITHDERGLNSFGLVPSFGVHFRDNVEKPSFEANYEVGFHRYTATNEYDRMSHNFDASYRRQLAKRLYARTTGEVSLKGSSEDREVNNNYVLEQQLQYRITPSLRVAALAAYRVKRYDPIEQGSDAIDSYVGAKVEKRFVGERRFEFEYRYDHNRAQAPRNRYLRRTYTAEFSTPLSFRRHDALLLELRYSPRAYTRRLISVNGERVGRRDNRWVFDVTYERALRSNLLMAATYTFEKRNSNDEDKRFTSNLFGLTFTFDWFK